MKKHVPNLLGAIMRDYFTEHLPRVAGMSPHTIHSYRDTLVLLLRFLSARSKRPVAELDLKDLDPPGILAFLSYLEKERKNGATTRNVRLSAIHALFRYVALRNPEHLDLAQRVRGIPFKRAAQRAIDVDRSGDRGDAVFRDDDDGRVVAAGIVDQFAAQRVHLGQRWADIGIVWTEPLQVVVEVRQVDQG